MHGSYATYTVLNVYCSELGSLAQQICYSLSMFSYQGRPHCLKNAPIEGVGINAALRIHYSLFIIHYSLDSPRKSIIEQHYCENCGHAGIQFRTRATLDRKQTNWIRPAPRASGLGLKWQCGVPSSFEERQKNDCYINPTLLSWV
jgi:hypothetical protein